MKIEKIFIVSLPERLVDRLIPLIDYLKSIDLDYSVFPASKHEDGKLGLLMTMEKLFTLCLQNDIKCSLFLEDDAHFIFDNPMEIINKAMEQVPKDFDCLFLGCNLWQNHVYKYSENLIQLKRGYSTHAIIYSIKGMAKILNALSANGNRYKAYDELLVKEIQKDGNCFCSFPMLVSQKNGYSDIENKEVNYDKILVDRFTERTKHL